MKQVIVKLSHRQFTSTKRITSFTGIRFHKSSGRRRIDGGRWRSLLPRITKEKELILEEVQGEEEKQKQQEKW
ncbi:hypothetical protein CsSME_00036579 [Camellia sinensis var. sinensis]